MNLRTNEGAAHERVILAIDTSEREEAARLAALARDAGARFVKLGLELSSATSWQWCSRLAHEHDLGWVADAKLKDIHNTVVKTVDNIVNLEHPPFGITIHTTVGYEAMRLAQERAEAVKMLGVTVLTSLTEKDVVEIYRSPTAAKLIRLAGRFGMSVSASLARKQVMQLAEMAADAGLKGVVASPLETGMIKEAAKTKALFAMIPGVRSADKETQDQARTATPAATVRAGADLLVIGRQITKAENPKKAYEDLIAEIETA